MRLQRLAPALLAIPLTGCGFTLDNERGIWTKWPMKPEDITVQAFGFFDTPPRFISGDAPIYPIGAVLDGRTGSTTIEFVVTEEGTTTDFTVLETDGPFWADHAIIAVQQWRFSPAMKDGKPVRAKLQLPMSYRFRN